MFRPALQLFRTKPFAIISVCASVLLFGIGMKFVTQNLVLQEKRAGLLNEWAMPEGHDTLTRQLSLLGLGGLRSLGAEILSLDAVNAWVRRDWQRVEERSRQMVTLCPKHANYWVTAARQFFYNAAMDAQTDPELSFWEKKQTARLYMNKGIAFLTEGLAVNPKSILLLTNLGDFLSDVNRCPQFARAAEYYHRAVQMGAPSVYSRLEFYALCRVSGREREALALGVSLFQDPSHRLPSLPGLIAVLQHKLDLPENERIPLETLFGNRKRAERILTQLRNNDLGFPTDGIDCLLEEVRALH